MQAKQLRTASMPLPLNATAFIVIVAVFQMGLGISGTIRHGSQSQHNHTLTLFEIRMQRPVSRYPAEEHRDSGNWKTHHAVPHGIRAECEDAVKAELAS
jgi:hypothetical protein